MYHFVITLGGNTMMQGSSMTKTALLNAYPYVIECMNSNSSIETTKLQQINNTAFKMYPNPANETLFFEMEESILLLELFTVKGEKILTQQNLSSNFSLNLRNIPNGVYIVKYQTTTAIAYQKINILH